MILVHGWVCVISKCVPITINYYNRHLNISHISLKTVYIYSYIRPEILFFSFLLLTLGK